MTVLYAKKIRLIKLFLSRAGHVKSCLNPGGLLSKAKYFSRSIVNEYREGKVKSTPVRGMK